MSAGSRTCTSLPPSLLHGDRVLFPVFNIKSPGCQVSNKFRTDRHCPKLCLCFISHRGAVLLFPACWRTDRAAPALTRPQDRAEPPPSPRRAAAFDRRVTAVPLFLPSLQRWRGQDRGVHHVEHRPGTDALRGGCRYFPDGKDAANTTACYGANRGKEGRGPVPWHRGDSNAGCPGCGTGFLPVTTSQNSARPGRAAASEG